MSDTATIEDFKAAGWNHAMAEALEGQERTLAEVESMTEEEVFDAFLEWNGIIGYTGMIIEAVSNCNMMKGASAS